MTIPGEPKAARVVRVVKAVLTATAGPLTLRELTAIIVAFGHPDLSGLDVMRALAELGRRGEVKVSQKAEFDMKGV